MCIYGLFSNEDLIIRYVGQTRINILKRLKQHIYGALKYNCKTHKDNWIRKVYNDGYKVKIVCLEEVDETNINDREIFWISQFKNLTNITEGGIGGIYFKYNISYEEMKSWLKENFIIKSKKDFNNLIKCDLIPSFMPKSPYEHFKKTNEWISWGDFLSTNNKNPNLVNYLSYNDAKKILKKYKIKTKKEFLERNKELRKINIEIPNRPERYYLKCGWKGYGDFLSLTKNYEITQELFIRYIKMYFKNITSQYSFEKNIKKMHKEIPKTNYAIFKKFKNFNWGMLKNDNMLSYKDAKKYIKKYKFNKIKEYVSFIKENNLTNILPITPNYYYKNKGWVNWRDYLSNDKIKCRYSLSLEVFIRYMKIYHKNINSSKKYIKMFETQKISSKIPKRPDTYFKVTWGELGVW